MLRLLAILLLLVLLPRLAVAAPRDWTDPDLGRGVVGGAATPDQLWLHGESGKIVAFDRRTGARRVVAAGVKELLQDRDHLWVLSRIDGRLALSDLLRPEQPAAAVPVDGELIGLFLHDGRPAILTDTSVGVQTTRGWRVRSVARRLPNGRPALAASLDGQLYLGLDRGEWGGGLIRIDPLTGEAWRVEELGDGGLCQRLLNPSCDPVSGLAPDPGNPSCVLVATGLAHMGGSKGHILRVCGQAVTPLFSASRPDRLGLGGEALWAYDGLALLPDGWIAPAGYRLFRSRGGKVSEAPLPPLVDWSGLRLNADAPDFVVVMDRCCWGRVDNPTEFSVRVIPVRPR